MIKVKKSTRRFISFIFSCVCLLLILYMFVYVIFGNVNPLTAAGGWFVAFVSYCIVTIRDFCEWVDC